jgi:hypothetical protein
MTTHLILFIDSSYSMRPSIPKIELGLFNLLKTLQNKTVNIYITLVFFSTQLQYIFKNIHISKLLPEHIINLIKKINFNTTSLYDCFAQLIGETSILGFNFTHLYIITDGEDNSSNYNTKTTTDNLISSLNLSENWKIILYTSDLDFLPIPNLPLITYKINEIDLLLNSLQELNI